MLIKELPPAERELSRGRTKKGHFMANSSVVDARRIRRILEDAVERFNNELLDEEERLELHDRIARLKRRYAEAAAETLEAHHSGLDRLGD